MKKFCFEKPFSALLAVLLVFGLAFVSCGNGDGNNNTPGGGSASRFEGTWSNAVSGKTWTFTGNNFTVTFFGINNARGTFTYTQTVITLTVTGAWDGSQWLTEWPNSMLPENPIIVNYSISGNVLTFVEDPQGPFTKR